MIVPSARSNPAAASATRLPRATPAGRAALAVATLLALAALGPRTAAAQSSAGSATADVVAHSLRAAPAAIALGAGVMDWEGNELKPSANGWVCYPSPPTVDAGAMCLDEAWAAWARAYANHEAVEIDRVGIAYMLQGDGGASNIDPYAEGPTPDNQWVRGGPHLMIIVPDPADLEGVPTDPNSGGPFVMWKGTPYAHIMVPVH